MKEKAAEFYRCPISGSRLALKATDRDRAGAISSGTFVSNEGTLFEIQEGIPNFIYPQLLTGGDAVFKEKYDKAASSYDEGLDWLFKSFYEEEQHVRTNMIEWLELMPHFDVLEIGCGTGKDSVQIASRLSEKGSLFLQDLSIGMLQICQQRLIDNRCSAEFSVGNASYLPFADASFDAVFHFGGLNTFTEKQRALLEMARVTRIGGTVLVGDEGVAPWLRETEYGKILIKANKLYDHEIPLNMLPPTAKNVSVKWILGNAFYLIKFEVGEGVPPVDLDLPIPGKADTLRQRYFGVDS